MIRKKVPSKNNSQNICHTLEYFSFYFDDYGGLALRKSMGTGQCKKSNKRHSQKQYSRSLYYYCKNELDPNFHKEINSGTE